MKRATRLPCYYCIFQQFTFIHSFCQKTSKNQPLTAAFTSCPYTDYLLKDLD